jgi:glycosyltransferase involved in cell wall biosynthesis
MNSQQANHGSTICLFTESYYPIVGGGETQGRILAEDLLEDGFRVIVITRRSNKDLLEFEKIGDIEVHRVFPAGSSHLNRWIMLLTSLPLFFKLRKEYDVIFVSGFRALGILAVLIGNLFSKPCILKADNNGEMSGHFFKGGLEKVRLSLSSPIVKFFLHLRNLLFAKADAFVCISEAINDEFIDFGVPKDKIHFIPNSVDTKIFFPVDLYKKNKIRKDLGINYEGKIIIFTGRLLRTKGLPLLLKVWETIQTKHKHCKLLIVGGGSKDIHDCELELKEYVKSHSLEESVIFTGNVYNVYEYLQASDIFVLPTEDEAFGISLIEAMACGLPVIATRIGGIKDILSHKENGLMIDAGDFSNLQEAIEQLISDDTLAQSLGQNALSKVKQFYARETVAKQYSDLFIDLIQTNKLKQKTNYPK